MAKAWRLHPPTETQPFGSVTECDDTSTLPSGAKWITEAEVVKHRNLTPQYPSARILQERRMKQIDARIEKAMSAGLTYKEAVGTAILLFDVDPADLKPEPTKAKAKS